MFPAISQLAPTILWMFFVAVLLLFLIFLFVTSWEILLRLLGAIFLCPYCGTQLLFLASQRVRVILEECAYNTPPRLPTQTAWASSKSLLTLTAEVLFVAVPQLLPAGCLHARFPLLQWAHPWPKWQQVGY